jgi:hypothetical protein
MHKHRAELSRVVRPSKPHRIRLIAEWWGRLRFCDDPGGTTWEVLDALERQVTECLGRASPDVDRAEQLTAEAALRMQRVREF